MGGEILTLLAKRREFSDSPKLSSSGEMLTNIKLNIKNKPNYTSINLDVAYIYHR